MAAVVVGAAGAPTASASTVCDPNGTHYYGTGCLFASDAGTYAFQGVSGVIWSSKLSTPNDGSLVINDMWIVNPVSPPKFIEAGIFSGDLCLHGAHIPPPCYQASGYKNFQFFWADDRPNSDYYAHLEGQAQSSTDYVDEMYNQGGGNWYVSIGGNVATSTNNPLLPTLIRTGTEEGPNRGEATSCSSTAYLNYEDWNSVWHASWGSASTRGYNSPPFSHWESKGSWLTDWAWGPSTDYNSSFYNCYGVLPSAASSTGIPGSTVDTSPTGPSSSSAETGPPLTQAQVSQIAGGFAAGMGDPNPTSIEHVASTRQQAVFALSDDKESTNPDVYAVVMRGHFVASNAPRPAEAAAPSGSVLTLVIDATTGALTDFGIQNQQPDLTSLGPVTVDR